MARRGATDVLAAFDMLLEEMDKEIERVNEAGASAFAARDYERVQEVRECGQRATELRERAAALRREWQALPGSRLPRREPAPRETPPAHGRRLRRGVQTPEEDFYRPILEALVALGGAGRVGDVLPRVQELMREILQPVDYQPIPSDRGMPRWNSRARWARVRLLERGLLESGSRHGIWQISDAGRAFLAAPQDGKGQPPAG